MAPYTSAQSTGCPINSLFGNGGENWFNTYFILENVKIE